MPVRGVVALRWRTASEIEAVGFNVFRSGTKVNRALIRAKHPGKARGAVYHLVDRLAPTRATYRLHVVEVDGKRVWRGTAIAR